MSSPPNDDFVRFIRSLTLPCALLAIGKGVRLVNDIRVSWREGKRVVITYRSYDDSTKHTGWDTGESKEELIEEFVKWCQPEVEVIGGTQRSCHLPF